MNTLFYYSDLDNKIRVVTVQNDQQASEFFYEVPNEFYFRLLKFKCQSEPNGLLRLALMHVSPLAIRLLLDALGHTKKYCTDGYELHNILFADDEQIKNVFLSAQHDKFIKNYLDNVFEKYIYLFKLLFGDLVLIKSKRDEKYYFNKDFNHIFSDPPYRYFAYKDRFRLFKVLSKNNERYIIFDKLRNDPLIASMMKTLNNDNLDQH
ncbi:MAG: hypothetical protein KDC52_11625 [Ignavibacteriae bacterium]|nr:hypothetical protein [Ignavibacteriota bacterium]